MGLRVQFCSVPNMGQCYGFLQGVLHGGVPGQSRKGQEVASSRQEIGKSSPKHMGNHRNNENIRGHKNEGFQVFLEKTRKREDGGTAPPEAEEALLKQVLDAAGMMMVMIKCQTSDLRLPVSSSPTVLVIKMTSSSLHSFLRPSPVVRMQGGWGWEGEGVPGWLISKCPPPTSATQSFPLLTGGSEPGFRGPARVRPAERCWVIICDNMRRREGEGERQRKVNSSSRRGQQLLQDE